MALKIASAPTSFFACRVDRFDRDGCDQLRIAIHHAGNAHMLNVQIAEGAQTVKKFFHALTAILEG